MATVTAVEVQKNNKQRVNIFVDGEFFCGMEAVSAIKFKLQAGRDVDAEKLAAAVFDSETAAAFAKSADYLARAAKTSSQMSEYLQKKGYTLEVVLNVLEKLQYYRYVDDGAYCCMYIGQNAKGKGVKRIKAELLARGADKEIVETALRQIDGEQEKSGAEALAQKYMKNKEATQKTLLGLQRYLLGRGYSFSTVNGIINKYREGENDWN